MARPKPGRGRTTPKGTPAERTPDIAAQVVDLAEAIADEGLGVHEADYWASLTHQYLRPSGSTKAPATAAKVLNIAAKRRSAGAAIIARALAVYGPSAQRERAGVLAEEIRGEVAAVPDWFDDLGASTPVTAIRLGDVFDDAFSIHVDFERGGATRGIAVRVDPISGWAQQFLFGGTTSEVRELSADDPHSVITELSLADARAVLDEAMERRDRSWTDDDDPTAENDDVLLALIEQRVALLPAGGVRPGLVTEMSPSEEVALINDFVTEHGGRHEAAATIAELIVTFARDLADGRPLIWSPSRVRMFVGPFAMVVPRSQPGADEMLAELPDVFADWLRFAAGRLGLPDTALQLNLDTIGQTRQLLEEFGPGPGGVPPTGGPPAAQFGPADEWPL